MKFVVEWTTPGPGAIRRTTCRAPTACSRRSGVGRRPPEWTISEFITHVDGRGGLLICETDDLGSIDRAVAQYLAWLDYEVTPVVDIGDGVSSLAAGSTWARTAGGLG